MRYRHVYMGLLTTLTLILLFVSNPDVGIIEGLPFGAGFITTIAMLLKATLFVAVLHVSRKGLFDYANLQTAWDKAMETPLSAAIALLAVILAMVPIAWMIHTAQVT